jgi:hypothetical protein
LRNEVSPEVVSVIENAVTRGVVRDLGGYIERVERFRATGEWQVTRLPPAERMPEKHVLVGPPPRPSSKRLIKTSA